jgi:hypothetical protein
VFESRADERSRRDADRRPGKHIGRPVLVQVQSAYSDRRGIRRRIPWSRASVSPLRVPHKTAPMPSVASPPATINRGAVLTGWLFFIVHPSAAPESRSSASTCNFEPNASGRLERSAGVAGRACFGATRGNGRQ